MRCRPDTGEKLLDLIDNCVLVADPGEVVPTGKLDELCARDPGGDVATLLDVRVQIAAPMQNKGRDPDGRQDVPHIDFGIHAGQGEGRARASGHAQVRRKTAPEAFVDGSDLSEVGQIHVSARVAVYLSI